MQCTSCGKESGEYKYCPKCIIASTEARDKFWEDLKTIVTAKLEECEASTGIKVGRDEIERQEHISRAAGMMYGHLVEEIKGIVEQVTRDISKRIERFG